MGQGFQFTPGGVRPIIVDEGLDPSAMHGAAPSVAAAAYDPKAIPDEPVSLFTPAPRAVQVALPKAATTAQVPMSTVGAITPRTVIKAARERLKEIKAELRRHEALKKERTQLERMLAATKKPLASLTPINPRRAG